MSQPWEKDQEIKFSIRNKMKTALVSVGIAALIYGYLISKPIRRCAKC